MSVVSRSVRALRDVVTWFVELVVFSAVPAAAFILGVQPSWWIKGLACVFILAWFVVVSEMILEPDVRKRDVAAVLGKFLAAGLLVAGFLALPGHARLVNSFVAGYRLVHSWMFP